MPVKCCVRHCNLHPATLALGLVNRNDYVGIVMVGKVRVTANVVKCRGAEDMRQLAIFIEYSRQENLIVQIIGIIDGTVDFHAHKIFEILALEVRVNRGQLRFGTSGQRYDTVLVVPPTFLFHIDAHI